MSAIFGGKMEGVRGGVCPRLVFLQPHGGRHCTGKKSTRVCVASAKGRSTQRS